MADEEEKRQDCILAPEHLLLGAVMGAIDEDGPDVPLAYGDEEAEKGAVHEGCALADLSGLYGLRIGGDPAVSFAEAAFAGRRLAVGECAFEPLLMGDGRLASVPLLARTGEAEYLVWDASPAADMGAAWLSFLSEIEQDGVKPYAGLELEDESDALVPLLLWGTESEAVLSDYLKQGETLPQAGQVAGIPLDSRIPAIVAHVPGTTEQAYLVLVPPAFAAIIWRSLLSFETVCPMGQKAFRDAACAALPWAAMLETADAHVTSGETLAGWGLLRDSHDYIGARALFPQG